MGSHDTLYDPRKLAEKRSEVDNKCLAAKLAGGAGSVGERRPLHAGTLARVSARDGCQGPAFEMLV